MKLTQTLLNSIKKFKFTFNWALFAIFIIFFAAIAYMNSAFLYPNYIIDVMLKNIIEIGLMALPMTLIIITGGIDLSVGSILVLSAVLGGIAGKDYGSTVGLIVTIVVGTLCGLINGLIIARIKISPLVTTLATMYLFEGIARGISHGDSIYSFSSSNFFGNGLLFGIPVQIFIYIILAIAFYLILSKTTLGRSLFGIGLNENATNYSGINTNKVKVGIYTLSGFMCSVSALMWLGRFTSIKYDAGESLNLIVITVVVLGGTSILGGYGNIVGTVIATLIIAVLNSGLTVLNIPIDTQIIVNGIVLVISLIVYAILNERVKNKRILKIDTSAITVKKAVN